MWHEFAFLTMNIYFQSSLNTGISSKVSTSGIKSHSMFLFCKRTPVTKKSTSIEHNIYVFLEFSSQATQANETFLFNSMFQHL